MTISMSHCRMNFGLAAHEAVVRYTYFIWWDSTPANLTSRVLRLCRDTNNSLWLSTVSIWEIQIKVQVGKLKLNRPLADLVTEQQADNGVQMLPVMLPHVLRLDALPLHHRDPFDRMLISQAQSEGATLLSRDTIMQKYDVSVIWQ